MNLMENTLQNENLGKKSKYNSAVSQILRMDDLLKDAHRHSRNTEYDKWNEDLDREWIELVADASPDQKKEMDEVNKKIAKLFIYGMNHQLLAQKNPVLYGKLILLQKKVLMQKEETIRLIQNNQGKGSSYEEDIDDYMD